MAFLPSVLPASDPYRRIREEIEGGLQNHARALKIAGKCLDYYNARFALYPVRPYGDGTDPAKYPRYSLVMQCAVNTLTSSLYKGSPVRTLTDQAAATEWLNTVYRANGADSLWQHADQLSTAADYAAFQVVPTADPLRPVRILLWDASQLVVWTDPDDQTQPIAVGVLDKYNEQRRCRLWTAETVTTFTTQELGPKQTAGGRDFRQIKQRENDLGFLPFSFVHFAMPLTDFHTSGPGEYLMNVNEGMNLLLTQGLDRVRFNLNPPIVMQGVSLGWAPPSSPIQPGDVWHLATDKDASGDLAKAEADYLEADTSCITAGWEDFENYLDHVLQMVRVPPAVVRMIQDSARSGVSIIAEQAPLVSWAESRQRPFTHYERQLAQLVCRVGSMHLGAQEDAELRATAGDLEAAADDPQLNIRWPDMYPRMPGPETDQADQWLLDNGLASRTTVLMRRTSMTREEAEAHLEEIAEDLRRERQIYSDVMPVPMSGTETREQMALEQEANADDEPAEVGES